MAPGGTQGMGPGAQGGMGMGPAQGGQGMMMSGDMAGMMAMMRMMHAQGMGAGMASGMMASGMMAPGMMAPCMMAPGGPAHIEGQIAFFKAELAITEAETPQWNAFADVLREQAKKTCVRRSPNKPPPRPRLS